MKTINLNELPEEERKSPKGKYQSFCKSVRLQSICHLCLTVR